jgi:hypothetical protein
VTLRHIGIAPEGRQAILKKKRAQQEAIAEAGPVSEPDVTERPEKGESAVPDVRSLPLRQAVIALHGESLVPEVRGSGIVVSQDPQPGKAVPHGAVVRLALEKRRFDEESSGESSGDETLTAAVSGGAHAQ